MFGGRETSIAEPERVPYKSLCLNLTMPVDGQESQTLQSINLPTQEATMSLPFTVVTPTPHPWGVPLTDQSPS
jgi:hypothetical protein